MISSKYKSGLAYAKICRDKSAPALAKCSPLSNTTNSSKENLYDSLINNLQADDSNYINQLLVKKERQSHKKLNKGVSNCSSQVFGDRSNRDTANISNRSSNNSIARQQNNVQMVSKAPNKLIKREIKKSQTIKQQQQYLTQERNESQNEPQQTQKFISNINDYLSHLSRQNNVCMQQTCQKQMKKTHSKKKRKGAESDEGQEWEAKGRNVEKIILQMQECLLVNQELSQKIEVKDKKMTEMKKIIQSMWNEMVETKEQLRLQQQKREYYQVICEDFAGKVAQANGRRQSQCVPKHMKRYSHVPTSNEILQDIDGVNSQTLFNLIGRKSLQAFQQRDSCFLKKRGRKTKDQINFHNASDYSDSDSCQQNAPYLYYD